jgi:GNAT superfamily N-acetyltransferase
MTAEGMIVADRVRNDGWQECNGDDGVLSNVIEYNQYEWNGAPMVNEIYDLYRASLPDIVKNEGQVKQLIADGGNHIISHYEDGGLAGVSVINENTIYLLCVDKPFRGRGIGADLLRRSEERIKLNGFDEVRLGVGKDYIMPGSPMNEGAHAFFEKNGYSHAFDGNAVFDMSMMLSDFTYDEYSVGCEIDGIEYRWAVSDDHDKIIECVADAEKGFVVLYQNMEQYEKGTRIPVLIAVENEEVLGAIVVTIETDGPGLGCIGATATAHKHRGRGVATNLVRLSTRHIKDIGLKKGFLSFTNTSVAGIYYRSGYEICMEYFMGRKNI